MLLTTTSSIEFLVYELEGNLNSSANKCVCRQKFTGNPLIQQQDESYFDNVNPYGSRSCCDEGKRVADSLCYVYRQQHGTDVRVALIFNAYGPSIPYFDGRVVSTFVAAAHAGKDLVITGDGTPSRCFQYVTDCVEGLMRPMALEYDGRTVNLGNDEECTIERLAELVIELVQKHSQSTDRLSRLGILRTRWMIHGRGNQIRALRKVARWHPTIDLIEGIERTIDQFLVKDSIHTN